MTDLPHGWAWSTLGSLGNYINGRGFGKAEWSTEGRPIIRIQNLTGSGSAFNYFDGDLESRYVVAPGSLLVSWAATLGVYRWSGPEGALNQHIFKVESFINEEFHRYVLQHALEVMQQHTHGSGMVHITRGRFDETAVPVPPLAEQQRIVTAIEEAFSKLDAGEAGLRTVRQMLRRMHGSVLAAAVGGRLVTQDPGDTCAVELLGRRGAEPLSETHLSELPPSWAWARVGDLLAKPLANGRSVLTRENGFPVLRLTCLRNGRIDLSERKGGDWDQDTASPFLVRRGDFLVSRGNGSLDLVGRGGLVIDEPDPIAYPDTLIRMQVHGDVLLPELLALWWNSRLVREQLESKARTTAGIYKVNQGMLAAVYLPIPPAEEQVRLVREVDRQMSFLNACDRAVAETVSRSAALRRSVLKAAFEGQLAPQDPTDEPASVLLDRLRTEGKGDVKSSGGRGRKKIEAS